MSITAGLPAFVDKIKFRFVQPTEKIPFGLRCKHEYQLMPLSDDWLGANYSLGVDQIANRKRWAYLNLPLTMRAQLHIFNTELPLNNVLDFAPILNIPKMSTVAIAAIIDRIVSKIPPGQCYVNVGVWNGFSLLAGMLRNPETLAIGVDNFSEFGGPREQFLASFEKLKSPQHSFFDMDYQDYFEQKHQSPIGCYFYDAAHNYEDQLQGLLLAEQFFSDDCIILIDDTNWPDPRRSVQDFIARRPGQYRILLDLTTSCNGHPTFWNGLMVLQRTGPQ